MRADKGRPCSPEMAQKIVNLLFRESSGDALLEFNEAMQTEKGQALFTGAKRRGLFSGSGSRRSSSGGGGRDGEGNGDSGGSRGYSRGARRKSRKVTPELIIFVHSDEIRTLQMNQTLEAIKEKFGIIISMSAVYKIWNMSLADVNRIREEKERDRLLKKYTEKPSEQPPEIGRIRGGPGRITNRKLKKEERNRQRDADRIRAEGGSTKNKSAERSK